FWVLSYGKNLGRIAMVGQVLQSGADKQRWISLEITSGNHFLSDMVRVIQNKMPTPLVEGVTVLRGSREHFQLVGVRTETNVPAIRIRIEHRRIRMARKKDTAATISKTVFKDHGRDGRLMRQINPIIESVKGRADQVLGIRKRKARQDDFSDISLPVVVTVLEIKDVGRVNQQDPILPA